MFTTTIHTHDGTKFENVSHVRPLKDGGYSFTHDGERKRVSADEWKSMTTEEN